MGQNQKVALTKQEQGILTLISKEGLTPAQISRRQKCSRQYVYKVINTLIEKGFLDRKHGVLVDKGSTPLPSVNQIGVHKVRLHGEMWSVRILHDSEHYRQTRVRASSIWLEGNRLVLYRDRLMLYSYQSFEGNDPDECDALANPYWHRFFLRIEQRYGVLILKNRSENIKRVKAHYAEMHNELAEDLRKKKEKLRIYSSRDGKEWALFDDSFGLDEAETTHSETPKDARTASEDMAGVIQPVFNDYREMARQGSLFLPSQQLQASAAQNVALDRILGLLAQQAALGRDTAASVQSIAKVLEAQLQAQNQGPLQPEPFPSKKPDYFG
jgi:DNA-binding CsgD family transcriptional regulator